MELLEILVPSGAPLVAEIEDGLLSHPVGDGLLVGLEMLTLTADQVVPL